MKTIELNAKYDPAAIQLNAKFDPSDIELNAKLVSSGNGGFTSGFSDGFERRFIGDIELTAKWES